MSFTPAESASCARLVELALAEDLGERGDLTSAAFIPENLLGKAIFVARSPGVLAGLPAVAQVVAGVGSTLELVPLKQDGERLGAGDQIAMLSGRVRAVLAAERTALNFLQRLSGVATLTRKYVDAVAGLPARILDTRKTTPGWRLLEKYAVRKGGGTNHRTGLFDAVLVKDNHVAALAAAGPQGAEAGDRGSEGSSLAVWDRLRQAVAHLRARESVPVELEVESFEQFERALACRPEMILLDNMHPDLMRRCVARRDQDPDCRGIQLEASGGVNLLTVRAIAESGVDCISIGALTHSAPALDIALDYID